MSFQRSIRIEPFKHRVELDPQYPDKTWKILEDAIREINNHNASGLSFEELYRNAYNMVLHKFGDRLYSGLENTLRKYLMTVAGQIDGTQGTAFLPEFRQRWLDHLKSMQMIRDILMYMDRTYVPQNDKMPVNDLGLHLWKECVVRAPRLRERLLQTLLELIYKERTGEDVDRSLLRSITQMLTDLGQNVYVEDFEKHFLAASADFYRAEAQQYIATSDCPDYLRKAEGRLDEELARVKHYLDAGTELKISGVVQDEMIKNQMKTLTEMPNSGLVPMLENDKYGDLSRMYVLFRKVDGGLNQIRGLLVAHLKEKGRGLVNDPERQKDPVEFVTRLLEEKDKCDVIVREAFANDKTFQNALNHAFEYFLNLNSRSPEFISLFVDDKLRKGLKGVSEEDSERVLDKVMMLFRYLQEKDVFEKYYKQHLAKRLLGGRTVSDDAERSFIVKLKTECGYQFTSKIEGMFTDMRTSRDLMESFKGMLEASRATSSAAADMGGVELNVQVLTTGSWPTPAGARCTLPPELERCCQTFKTFYLSRHTGRRLAWQTNMGTADLKASFPGARHELTVSTYQMCILLMFNAADSLSYREIAAATDIPAADLKRNLQSLACVKGKNVLRKEPMSKDIEEEDVFIFNDKFISKLHKVKIGTVSAQKESEPEKQETRQRIEDDRKPQIEAAVVRIMKARRVLDHNSLITEVTKQLSTRFMANPAVIKKRIESLIEREFLERDRNDRKLYRYLA